MTEKYTIKDESGIYAIELNNGVVTQCPDFISYLKGLTLKELETYCKLTGAEFKKV